MVLRLRAAQITASGQGDRVVPGALFCIRKLEECGTMGSPRAIIQHSLVAGLLRNDSGSIAAGLLNLENLLFLENLSVDVYRFHGDRVNAGG